MTLTVKRFLNVVDTSEIDVIKRMISRKEWSIHSSNEDSKSKFFITQMTSVQTHNFLSKFSAFVRQYLIENNIKNEIDFERAYINCHPAYHPGEWHLDNESGVTALYYPDMGVNFGEEGGTDIKDHGYELYIPNSLLIFPGNIEHMARQHTSVGTFRFSIAFKFIIKNDIQQN
jgi:hypothetical protein